MKRLPAGTNGLYKPSLTELNYENVYHNFFTTFFMTLREAQLTDRNVYLKFFVIIKSYQTSSDG